MFSIIRSGLNTTNQEISIISNNIANANATGFKKSRAKFEDIFSISDEKRNGTITGLGSFSENPKRLHSQGSLKQTGGALDLAISGIGLFVLEGKNENGQLSFTRDGSFQINSDQEIVTNDGSSLLGINQEKLIVPFSIQREDGSIEYLSEVKVESDGRILASYDFEKDQEIGQVLLAKFDNEADLFATGNNKYIASDLSGQAELGGAMTGGFGEIQAGSLEMSNVIITDELVSLIKAQQAFNGAAKILQTEIDISKKFTG